MKIIVNPKNYTNYEYSPYLKRGEKIEAPENPSYVVGQVVVIPDENHIDPKNNFVLAVVLGCIDEEFDGELRTDMHGMVCMNDIRPASIDDFGKSNISYRDELHKECRGFKVSRNWETMKYIIEEPNAKKYYQPDFGDEETLITPDGTELWSYYVYSSLEKANEDFPGRKIIEYSEGDIEEPYIIK